MIYRYDIDPIAFSIMGLDVRWYGLAYIAAFLIGQHLGWYIYRRITASTKTKLNQGQYENLVFGTFLSGVLGGRLGYFLFYRPETLWSNPLELLAVWQGGMSIHGGFILALGFAFWYLKRLGINFWNVTDSLTIPTALGLFLGRIANFVNGELVGRPTDQTWGVIFPHVDELLRHPSQLYEAGKNIDIVIILGLILYFGGHKKAGLMSAAFLMSYGVFRFGIEFVREPSGYVGPFTTGQVLCLFMVLISLGIFNSLKKN